MNKISQTIMESLEEFDKSLDEWVESDEHKFHCTSWSEGQLCCLDAKTPDNISVPDGRGFSKSHLLQSQIKLIEVMIESLVKSKSFSVGETIQASEGSFYPSEVEVATEESHNAALEDQISSLTEVLNELKNV